MPAPSSFIPDNAPASFQPDAPRSFVPDESPTSTTTTPQPSPLAQGINEQNKLAVETFGKAMDMLAVGAEAGAIQGQRTEAGIRAVKRGLGELETPPTQSIPQPKLPQRATIGGEPQPLETYIGSPEERQAAFKQAALSPVIPIPKFTINADDSKTMAVGKSIVNFLTGIVEFAESPAGILAAPVAAAAPTATAVFFTADMANSIGTQATEMGLNWDKMTDAQKAAAVTDTSATGLLALALGAGAGRNIASKAKQGLETIAVKPTPKPSPSVTYRRPGEGIPFPKAGETRPEPQAVAPPTVMPFGVPPVVRPTVPEQRVTDETVFNEALARQQTLQAEITAKTLAPLTTAETSKTTEVPNAQTIRENQGQLLAERQVAQESQGVGGADVERPAPEQPQPVEPGKETQTLTPITDAAVKETPSPQVQTGGIAQPPPPPPAQPVGTEAGKAVDIKPGDKIKWEPNERERKYQGPVEGTVVDVISNTEGEKGYHVLVPLEGDPGNVVRVWDNRGKIVSHEPSQVEPPTVRAPESSGGDVGSGRTPTRAKTVVEIADEIAARGIDPQASYGQFVKARDLKPEILAKEWLPIYRKSLELAKLNKQIAITKRQSPTPEPPASQKPAPPAPTSEGRGKAAPQKITHFKHKDGKGLLDRSAWDLSKLTESEELALPELLDFGLQQPRGVPAGSKFYFTEEGLKKHAKLIRLIRKASKTGLVKETTTLGEKPVWESADGQVAIKPTPYPTAGAGEKPTRFGKGGPGAAAATEPGTYDPAAQLADALKTVKETDPLKRAQDISRVTELWEVGKDATTRAWGRVVAAKESIKDTLLNQDEITPLKRLVAALDFQIQKSSAMSRDLGRTFEQTHPSRVRRNAIAIFVDAGLDAEKVKAAIAELPKKTPLRVRRAFEAATELTPKERDTAERIKTYFEQRLQDAQQAGVLRGFLEDYYTHVWKKPERMPEELKNAMSNGRVVTYFENARQRSLQDFITGVKLGLEPVLDPALVVPRYNFNLDRAIASRAFVKKLSETTEADGRTTVAPTGIGRQVSSTEYVVRNDETGRTRRVFETREEADAVAREGESVVERENTATMISPKTKSPESEGYVVVDNPALRKWKWATNDSAGNPILVEGDLVVHPDAVNRIKNIMERERLTPGKSMRFLIRAGAEVKGAKLGVLSPFHQIHVGSHALFHLVNPFSLKPEIDWTHPFTRFAVEKGGLKLAADFHDKMAFSEGIGPGLIVQKIVPFARMYSEYLFESFIPRLKLKTFEAVYQRDLKRYAGKLSEEQIAARAGDAVNNAYGELNRLWLGKDGRDPRLQRAMQVTMLAPDFLEGRVRFVAKAFTKYGKEERMALFVMGASLYVTARVLNQLFDGDPHAKEPNMMFSVRVGDKNYSIRSVLGDLNHLLTDWRSFASTRINPVTTRTAVELLTKRDIRTGLSKTTADEFVDALRQVVPSQLDSMLPGDRQWWFGFMQSLGLTARRQPTLEQIRQREEKAKKDAANPPAYEMIYNPKHVKKTGIPPTPK